MKNFIKLWVSSAVITLFSWTSLSAQTQIVQDYSLILEIPNIKAMQASTSHLYVLSELEGMAVFRAYGDSLQWLYTTSGMQRRGNIIETDIRFAYLYGNSRRLTVLEPTSVLGVYSSTNLPDRPWGVARLQNSLFVAMGSEGLGILSLDTPETVDSEPELVANDVIGRADVLDVASSVISNQLFVLGGNERLHAFKLDDEGLENISSFDLETPITKLFIDGDHLWGSTAYGEVFELNANGRGRKLGQFNEAITDILFWENQTLIRGTSGKIWKGDASGHFSPWKSEQMAGNFITESENTVWLGSFDKISSLKIGDSTGPVSQNSTPAGFNIEPIGNRTLTYPNSLILALELEDNYPTTDVEFSYRSANASNAVIKKQGFFWQPSVNQVGYTKFTIIATNAAGEIDSTSFTVDVRTFNAPPRFSPVRGSTVVVNDPFELQFNAVDPENPSSTLIRYLGVDLPEGSSLDERTGLFKWTPTERQVGERTFRIVATDAQGAAASQDVTFNVIELSRNGEQ